MHVALSFRSFLTLLWRFFQSTTKHLTRSIPAPSKSETGHLITIMVDITPLAVREIIPQKLEAGISLHKVDSSRLVVVKPLFPLLHYYRWCLQCRHCRICDTFWVLEPSPCYLLWYKTQTIYTSRTREKQLWNKQFSSSIWRSFYRVRVLLLYLGSRCI